MPKGNVHTRIDHVLGHAVKLIVRCYRLNDAPFVLQAVVTKRSRAIKLTQNCGAASMTGRGPYELVRDYWRGQVKGENFEQWWASALHEGVIQRMGKRTGQFLLLEDVLDAVGVDATRFFLLQRSADAPLDFDLELAVQQSNDNPVYYVQYAHARIASIFRTAAERGLTVDGADVSALTSPAELDLVRLCLRFPELVAEVLEHKGVHLFTSYALELAGAFHSFYRDNRVVDEGDVPRSKARLRLVQAVQVALRQTLGLLGVSAPEKM